MDQNQTSTQVNSESKRVKITEIKENYAVKRKEKVNGEITEVEKTTWRYKEVPYVTGWARFGHFLLDRIFYAIAELIFSFSLGAILALLGMADIILDMNETVLGLLIFIFLYPMYYLLLEASTGASLAKLILGRVVVDEYGDKPTFKQILGRSYARIVPFEVFSCLGTTGWHDSWSNTFVIRKQDLEDLKVLARLQEHLEAEPGASSSGS